jgi:hypothetical protein
MHEQSRRLFGLFFLAFQAAAIYYYSIIDDAVAIGLCGS